MGTGAFHFILKQAVIATSLALTGNTIAQLKIIGENKNSPFLVLVKQVRISCPSIISHHDWFYALRMTSYGFLLYGPCSYAWYKYLDHFFLNQSAQKIMLKVLLNQIVLGPCVIVIALAWNNLWLGKLSELPNKYQKDAFPTLIYGFRFWIPVCMLNFWVVLLQARVAFMST
ncbi:hypothetical protein CRYUN_Cryun33cG0016100 [Craigia yunnanensis]